MKFLVVDDIPVNRIILITTIRKILPNAEIEEAEDGNQAILFAEMNKYDIIFMDLMMPDVDGLEAIQEIRNSHGLSQQSKICILSAHKNSIDQCKQKEIAPLIDRIFSKPVSITEIKDWILSCNTSLA